MSKDTLTPSLSAGKSIGRVVGYGVGDFGLNLFWHSLSQLLFFYYASVLNVSPAIAGFIFFAGTLWDAATDPAMAALAERTKTRWGRYRPYLLIGGVALGAAFVFLMTPFHSNSGWSIALLLIAHLLFRASYTLVSVPYSALSSTITGDGRKRTILSGYRMFFAFLGGFAVSAFAFPIVRTMGDGTDTSKFGFFCFAVICAIIANLCFLICFFATREHAIAAKNPPSLRKTLTQAASSLRHNRSLHTLIAFISCQSGAGLVFASMLTLYVQGSSHILRPIEVILGVNALASIVMLPLWTFIAHRFGKRRTWLICSFFVIAPGFHMAFFGPLMIDGFVLQILLIACAQSAFGVLVWSMIPDTIEYGAWKTGVHSEAATFGAALFMQKTSIGVAGLTLGFILEAIGYDAQAAATDPATIEKIGVLVGGGPALLIALALLPLWLHPVTSATHEAARKAINQR